MSEIKLSGKSRAIIMISGVLLVSALIIYAGSFAFMANYRDEFERGESFIRNFVYLLSCCSYTLCFSSVIGFVVGFVVQRREKTKAETKAEVLQTITLGMTQEEVRQTCGEPTSIDERETTQQHVKERWVYKLEGKGLNNIYFEDGVVVKIQEKLE